MRAWGLAVVAALFGSGCDCTPSVDGVLAEDVLPVVSPAGFTERVHTLVAPESGDLDIRFQRQDGAEGYTGFVYLFVTAPECVSVSADPQGMRNGQTFRPQCRVLANSLGSDCCLGRTGLSSPARVERGQTLKVFVYGLSQPLALPYRLTYRAGDAGCRTDTANSPS